MRETIHPYSVKIKKLILLRKKENTVRIIIVKTAEKNLL